MVVLVLAAALLVPQSATGLAIPASMARTATPSASDVELVGAFFAGGLVTGAALLDGYLYVTTPYRLSIYDASEPLAPTLIGTRPSAHDIYGELISTNGKTLLLNNGLSAGTVDVWDVEDKSNPVVVATVRGVRDEHVSCLLDCRWAYGSNGTIIDLRRPASPKVVPVDWKQTLRLGRPAVHRVDEFTRGFLATAPRQGPPVIIDARKPLQPRVIGRTQVARKTPSAFLFSSWLLRGRDRFVLTSTEKRRCSSDHEGALVTFDSKGWPVDRRFEVADTYRYRGRAEQSENSCAAYYFDVHPEFPGSRLIVLPNGLEGTRIVRIKTNGNIDEVDSFVPPVSNVWLAFWVNDEIFYALNATGEVYILRYR